ncbi:cell division cycle-associated protein 4 [Eucyclogobius newberryi]|uniref:cell division cycle-associated protein 4 n=1 Tax=Eucyclogobius newberryi TaxID=166745 RepID=UPI003B58D96A
MFPKGTKRKFSDGEEAAPSEAPGSAAAAAVRTLSSAYSLQRQSLLDMSLIKLQLCHMLVEPNLCRSVLIANTVRQIQEEMTQDGTWQLMTQALAQCPSDRLVASEVLCRQDPAAQSPKPVPSALEQSVQEEGYQEEVVMEEDSPAAPSPQLGGAPYLGPFGSSWDEEEEVEEEEEDSEESVSEPEEESRTEQVFGTFEIKQPPADPALEELFSDVDPSYYDLDTVLMQSPKMGPYDLLESLSHSPALSSTASCRSDLNELDHIMEIIVGS